VFAAMLRRVVPVLIVLVALGAVAPALAAGVRSPAASSVASRRAALAVAERLVAEVVMPAGSAPMASEPPGSAHQLDDALTTIPLAATVSRTRFWITNASLHAVIAAVTAHAPPRWRVLAGGYSPGVAESVDLVPDHESVLVPRQLLVDAVMLLDGRTGVRVDAQVAYTAPRRPAQRIPAAARVLEITVGPPAAPPSLRMTVTRRAAIRRIAAAIDALPFISQRRGVAISCPAMPVAPFVTFTFLAAPGGPVLARVRELADTPSGLDPCDPATLVIRGHHEPGLMAGGRLLRVAAAVLGVRLAGAS
jgi:hypothetical protein